MDVYLYKYYNHHHQDKMYYYWVVNGDHNINKNIIKEEGDLENINNNIVII